MTGGAMRISEQVLATGRGGDLGVTQVDAPQVDAPRDDAARDEEAGGDWSEQTRRVLTRDLLVRASRTAHGEGQALRFRARQRRRDGSGEGLRAHLGARLFDEALGRRADEMSIADRQQEARTTRREFTEPLPELTWARRVRQLQRAASRKHDLLELTLTNAGADALDQLTELVAREALRALDDARRRFTRGSIRARDIESVLDVDSLEQRSETIEHEPPAFGGREERERRAVALLGVGELGDEEERVAEIAPSFRRVRPAREGRAPPETNRVDRVVGGGRLEPGGERARRFTHQIEALRTFHANLDGGSEPQEERRLARR